MDNYNSSYFRKSGATTRIVDKSIQELFNEGETKIRDHYDSYISHKRVLNIFLKRLNIEHGIKAHELEINFHNRENYFFLENNFMHWSVKLKK